MIDKILIIYGLVDDILKALDHPEDPRRQMEDGEMITTGLVAVLWFDGNLAKARSCLGPTHACYFYGVRTHILTTTTGLPVEFIFMPGAPHDSQALSALPLDLPAGSTIYGDSALYPSHGRG